MTVRRAPSDIAPAEHSVPVQRIRRPAASSDSRASEDCQVTPVRVQDIVPQDRNLLLSQSQSTAVTDPRAGACGAIAQAGVHSPSFSSGVAGLRMLLTVSEGLNWK